MKAELKPPGTKLLKLKYDILLSTSAFKFNLRRYSVVPQLIRDGRVTLPGLNITVRCTRFTFSRPFHTAYPYKHIFSPRSHHIPI
jgi:hypothetical protein